MKIIITSKKPVLTAECGRLPSGVPVDVSDALGAFLVARGDAAKVEVKAPVTLKAPEVKVAVKAK
jgi:hypothetical protein